MTTRFQKLHITSRLISAYLLQCSQIPINALFCRFISLFANTEMYEAINKLPGFALPIAIVAKCEEITNLAQKILIWRQLLAKEKSQVDFLSGVGIVTSGYKSLPRSA